MRRWGGAVLLLVAVLGIGLSGRRHAHVRAMREAYQLAPVDPLESMPPMVAFTTVAFGGFRGLVADALWMRAGTLQQEGRYFELVQLADWITKLQPRFASVWAYHAWNLAYNISVMMDDHADRWRWVRHGVNLLRDEGLRYNPGNASLHRELAWLFFHKIGADFDNAHMHYKREWAREMEQLFDGAAPDYAKWRDLPASRERLQEEPETGALIRALREAGVAPFSFTLVGPDPLPESAAEIVARYPEGAERLRAFIRRQRLREVYRMDPARMERIDQQHGPLDWRLPQAHAIYWSDRGLDFARTDAERVSLDRMVFQSMADAFLRGRVTIDPDRGLFVLRPNLDVLSRVRSAYESAISAHPEEITVRVAHENFLVDAIMISVSYNRMRQAREMYADLTARYPNERNLGGFDAFVARTYAEFMGRLGTREATAVVESAWMQSFLWEALGDPDQAAGYAELARLSWTSFMEFRADDEVFRERTGLPPQSELRARGRERARETLQTLSERDAAIDPTR